MGANLLLAYLPAAKITKSRRRVLHRLVQDLNAADLDNEEIDVLADGRDVQQMLHEYVELLPVNSELHRDVAEFALPHMPYRVLFTGGSSWGDSPCELFDSLCGAQHNESSVALFVMWRPVNSSRKTVAECLSFTT